MPEHVWHIVTVFVTRNFNHLPFPLQDRDGERWFEGFLEPDKQGMRVGGRRLIYGWSQPVSLIEQADPNVLVRKRWVVVHGHWDERESRRVFVAQSLFVLLSPIPQRELVAIFGLEANASR